MPSGQRLDGKRQGKQQRNNGVFIAASDTDAFGTLSARSLNSLVSTIPSRTINNFSPREKIATKCKSIPDHKDCLTATFHASIAGKEVAIVVAVE